MSSLVNPTKEFHLSVLGISGVGKTSLCERLVGASFKRSNAYKQSLEDYATKYSFEVSTSAGLLLFHFYDWGWEQKRRDQSINQELMRGSDGVLFLYDVTNRRSMSEFREFADWYQRAAGFDKPCLIISNKNDQKKKAVQDNEGAALAGKGDKRGYVAISLVDDTGLDDLVSMLSKIMMQDVNLSISGPFHIASESSIAWSNEISELKFSSLGLGVPPIKIKKFILVALNSSVIEKFSEICFPSEYTIEAVSSPEACEEELANPTAPLAVAAIVAPPTCSESQQARLKAIADKYGVPFAVTVPRNVLATVTTSVA